MLSYVFGYCTENMPIAGALWFLPSLFFTQIFFKSIRVMLKSDLGTGIGSILIMCIGMNITDIVKLPWGLHAALVGVGFYFVGYVISKNKEKKMIQNVLHLSVFQVMCLSLIVVFLVFINGYVNMRIGEYSNILLSFINAVVVTVIIWNFCIYFDEFTVSENNKPMLLLKRELNFVGRNTIVYVCLNQLVILIVTHVINIIPVFQEGIGKLFGKLLILVGVMVSLKCLVKIFSCRYLKQFIGR